MLFGSLFSSFEVLLSPGFLLSLELVVLDLFGLLLEDGLNEHSSVLELVTLGGEVELVVDGSVDLLGGSVLLEQSPQHSLPSHPEHLGGHSALEGASALTDTGVSAESDGLEVLSGSGPGVHLLLPLHDEAVLDEFADEDSGVGLADLLHFAGVDPDSLSAALEHFRCQSFLTFETHHQFYK